MIILPFSKKNKKAKKEEKESDNQLEPDPRIERLKRYKSRQDFSTSLIYNDYEKIAINRWNLFWKKISFRQYDKAFSHFIFFVFNSLGVILKISLWFFFLVFTCVGMIIIFAPLQYELNYYRPFFTSTTSTIVSVLFWCAIIYAMIGRTKGGNSKFSRRFLQIIPLVFLIFLTVTIYQKGRAEKTINHSTYDISFQYDTRQIESTKEKVFVGKTSDYIFLRDVKNQRNFIYPISDIKNLEINKINL